MKKLFEDVCHEGGSSSASLAVRSNLLATCGRDRCVKIWNTNIGATDTLVKKLDTTAAPECVHFSHDEHHLTYGSMSGAIKLVDVASGKEMRTLSGHRGKVFLVCQSPKSIYTWASGSLDNTIILWDIRQHPAAVATFRQHSKAVCALQFSPNAAWLASGAEDCKVKLVDVRAGGDGLLADLVGHSGSITDVRFHPSDYLLASGSADKTVRFWDLETYECVTQSQPATSAVRKIRFSRDGGALLTATEKDARAIHWEPFDLLGQAPLPPDAITTLDCAATADGLRLVAALPTSLTVLDAHIEAEESSSESGATTSAETSPVHGAMPTRRRNSKTRTKSLSSPSKSPARVPSDHRLDISGDDAFKKRDKLPRSRPQSPPPMQFDCLPSEEVFAVSVVSTAKGGGTTTTTTTTKTTKQRTVERQSSTGKCVERKPSLTRAPANNGRISGGNKSTTKTVVAVEPLGRKIEKVSPLPRPTGPMPNIPGQVLRTECKPLVAVTPATPTPNNTSASSCVDPSEFLPNDRRVREIGVCLVATVSASCANRSRRGCSPVVLPGQTSLSAAPIADRRAGRFVSSPIMMMFDDGASFDYVDYSRRPSAIRLEPLLPSKCVCGDRRNVSSAVDLFDFGGRWTIAEEKCPPVRLLGRAPTYIHLRRSSTPDALTLNSRAADLMRRSGVDRKSSMQLSDRGMGMGALRLTSSPLATATSALNERDCIVGISKDAQTMHVVLQHRANAIHSLRQTWKSGGLQRAVDVALQTNDQTLIVELLNTLNSRSSLWSLHLCAQLLSEIGKLLESKHEVYVQTAVHSLRVIVGSYGEMIRNGIVRTSSIGVDPPREERYEKCKRCHSQLMAIRSLAGSNAKLGRHTSAYREVGVLMQLFDPPV
uniref:Katanin p80 subunit C-terminal domain-containing protein n=1 Tax=Plectus sambesii TaxID=2011161 RepID=A0A914VRB7_9BILA